MQKRINNHREHTKTCIRTCKHLYQTNTNTGKTYTYVYKTYRQRLTKPVKNMNTYISRILATALRIFILIFSCWLLDLAFVDLGIGSLLKNYIVCQVDGSGILGFAGNLLYIADPICTSKDDTGAETSNSFLCLQCTCKAFTPEQKQFTTSRSGCK